MENIKINDDNVLKSIIKIPNESATYLILFAISTIHFFSNFPNFQYYLQIHFPFQLIKYLQIQFSLKAKLGLHIFFLLLLFNSKYFLIDFL